MGRHERTDQTQTPEINRWEQMSAQQLAHTAAVALDYAEKTSDNLSVQDRINSYCRVSAIASMAVYAKLSETSHASVQA